MMDAIIYIVIGGLLVKGWPWIDKWIDKKLDRRIKLLMKEKSDDESS